MGKQKELAHRAVVGAAFFFLFGLANPALAQKLPPGAVLKSPNGSRTTGQTSAAGYMDDFAGLDYTAEQKAQIQEINREKKDRIDAVVKDQKLMADQKQAMLDGYQRLERIEMYRILTPKQQLEVRKKLIARQRAAAQQSEERKKHTLPPQ